MVGIHVYNVSCDLIPIKFTNGKRDSKSISYPCLGSLHDPIDLVWVLVFQLQACATRALETMFSQLPLSIIKFHTFWLMVQQALKMLCRCIFSSCLGVNNTYWTMQLGSSPSSLSTNSLPDSLLPACRPFLVELPLRPSALPCSLLAGLDTHLNDDPAGHSENIFLALDEHKGCCWAPFLEMGR